MTCSDDFLNRDKFTTLQEELEKARNTVSLNDFAIAGDNLLIACGHHGIGVFPLQELLKEYRQRQKRSEEDNEEDRLIRFRSFGSGYNLARIYKSDRHLRKVEGLEEVHTLIPQSDGRTIAVSYGETSLKLDYMMLDL